MHGAEHFDLASSTSSRRRAWAEKRAELARIREDKILAEIEVMEASASEEDGRSRCSGTSSQKRRDRLAIGGIGSDRAKPGMPNQVEVRCITPMLKDSLMLEPPWKHRLRTKKLF